MSRAEITPGPWRVDAALGAHEERWITADSGTVAAVACSYTAARRDANARAIAALPELLAAADEACECLDGACIECPGCASREDEECYVCRALWRLRAALRKVYGEVE